MKKLIYAVILMLLVNCIPVGVFAEDNNVKLVPNAVSSVLMDAESGKIIFEKDMNKKVAVASMT